jgi:hypothetical protein
MRIAPAHYHGDAVLGPITTGNTSELLRPGYFLVGYLLGGLISPATAVA